MVFSSEVGLQFQPSCITGHITKTNDGQAWNSFVILNIIIMWNWFHQAGMTKHMPTSDVSINGNGIEMEMKIIFTEMESKNGI